PRRLHLHLHRRPGARGAELPNRPGPHVHLLPLLRPIRRGTVLARVRGLQLEPGEDPRPAEQSMDTHRHHRDRRHRRDDADRASEPLGRVAPPLRHHSPGQGTARGEAPGEVPSTARCQPIVSTIGWLLPSLISGEIIFSVVLNLPTTGPVMLRALESQDMYLAGSFLLLLSVLTVIGTLISDILLARLDPRIRYG